MSRPWLRFSRDRGWFMAPLPLDWADNEFHTDVFERGGYGKVSLSERAPVVVYYTDRVDMPRILVVADDRHAEVVPTFVLVDDEADLMACLERLAVILPLFASEAWQ